MLRPPDPPYARQANGWLVGRSPQARPQSALRFVAPRMNICQQKAAFDTALQVDRIDDPTLTLAFHAGAETQRLRLDAAQRALACVVRVIDDGGGHSARSRHRPIQGCRAPSISASCRACERRPASKRGSDRSRGTCGRASKCANRCASSRPCRTMGVPPREGMHRVLAWARLGKPRHRPDGRRAGRLADLEVGHGAGAVRIR